MTASACSAALWHLRGGVVHRSSCRLDLVVTVWLDVLTRLKVDGVCRMEARRVDRETAESVAGICPPAARSLSRSIAACSSCRFLTAASAGDAWPSHLSRPARASVIPFGLLAAVVLIIFALLWRVTRL
jgi:hypothetical protein